MRVAAIYLGRDGGGPRYSFLACTALARYCEVKAFISKRVANRDDWLAASLPVMEVDTYDSRLEFVLATARGREIRHVAREVAAWRPDVVYYPMFHWWTPLINRRLRSYPIVLTVHEPKHAKPRRNRLWVAAQDWAIRQSDRFILLAEAHRSGFCADGPDPDAVDVVPHGEFGSFRRHPHAAPPRTPPGPPTLLFFGRIEGYKGLDVLLDAIPLVRSRVPSVRLRIVGSGDLSPYADRLQRLDNVELVNEWVPQESISTWFEGVTAVVVPYRHASQSGVIPIAYAHEVPVVVTNVGGLPEQVEQGETGLLVPPEDPASLADACVFLLTHEDRAAEMGRAGRALADAEWSWDRIASALCDSFSRAVAARAADAGEHRR